MFVPTPTVTPLVNELAPLVKTTALLPSTTIFPEPEMTRVKSKFEPPSARKPSVAPEATVMSEAKALFEFTKFSRSVPSLTKVGPV